MTRQTPLRRIEGNARPRRRAIAAIRVSKERENMTSPENQRYIIEAFAERENVDIIEWIEGIDESGSRAKSAWWARLSYACDRIEAGAAELLLVWRIDRTARHRLKWAITEDRIATAGGQILSSTEPNDQSPAGQFGRGVMVEHAVFMANSIGATWKETLERRVRHGLTPNGQRHFGYTYSKGDGYAIDPVEGPILADMYRSYAAGEAAWAIAARYSNPDAAPTNEGSHERYARWNTAAILRLLDSGFGAGYILFRGELHDGVHPPVISADDWTRYRHARDNRRRRPRAERSPYLYSGMLYCHCGSRMGGRTDHGRPRYACNESAQYEHKRHPDASLAAHIIDDALVVWFDKIREKLNKAAAEAPRRPTLVADPAKDIARRIAAETEKLDNATTRFFENPDVVSPDAYQRYREGAEAKIAALQQGLTRASAQATVQPLAFVGDILSRWGDLPIERQREALRMLIDRITVNPPDAEPRIEFDSPHTRS